MRLLSFVKALTLVCAFVVLASTSFGQTYPGTGVGPVPDGGAAGCGDFSAAPLNVSFAVSGITSALSDVKVSFTMSPAHSWVGDLRVILKAPANVASHTILSRTNQPTAAGCGTGLGGDANAAGPYTFSDTAPAAPTWWAAAVTAGATGNIPSGSYRTSVAGGGTANQGTATVMTAVFSGLSPAQINGNWTLEFADGGGGDTGTVSAASLILTSAAAPLSKAPVDFNGDGKTDWSVVRNVGAGGTNQVRWFNSLNGGSGVTGADWGISTDFFTPVDFDGDGKTDIAVWRPAAATVAAFYILQSQTNTLRTVRFGQTGDDPTVVGDYDGDGKADPAVYRPGATGAQSTWFYLGSLANPSGNTTYLPWGVGGDFVSPGDYDGDGKYDLNVQRTVGANAQYILRGSSNGATTFTTFGLGTDFIVPGDYDGDGKTDIAVRRTISGVHNFFILQSSNAVVRTVQFGATGFNTATGDYDGDGKTDIAEWQPSTGIFWVLQSTNSAVTTFQLGASGDFPVAAFNVH
jgi:subtilisin-like proprotein convertase family protein